jgi:hypothetical protein
VKSNLVTQSQRGEAFIAKNQSSVLTMIVREQQRAAFIAKGVRVAVTKPAGYCVHIASERGAAVILAGQRGPQGIGIPGPAGGSAVQRAAGETLSALRAVYELDDQVFTLDYRDTDHINLLLGVTLSAGDIGQLLNVQRSGAIDDASWSWTPGPVWLGANGALTQVSPVDGYDVLIGSANSATRITLNLQDPIELE